VRRTIRQWQLTNSITFKTPSQTVESRETTAGSHGQQDASRPRRARPSKLPEARPNTPPILRATPSHAEPPHHTHEADIWGEDANHPRRESGLYPQLTNVSRRTSLPPVRSEITSDDATGTARRLAN